MSSLLPTNNRDVSPTPTAQVGASSSGTYNNNIAASTRSGSTQVGGDEDNEKRGSDIVDEKAGLAAQGRKEGISNGEYLDKGVIDIEDEGRKRQVRVVLENKSGREMFKEMAGGPYTQPRW
jgi:hypothetical protein